MNNDSIWLVLYSDRADSYSICTVFITLLNKLNRNHFTIGKHVAIRCCNLFYKVITSGTEILKCDLTVLICCCFIYLLKILISATCRALIQFKYRTLKRTVCIGVNLDYLKVCMILICHSAIYEVELTILSSYFNLVSSNNPSA